MGRLLKLEPAAVGAVIAAVYAAVISIYRATKGQGVIEPDLIVAAVTALWGAWTRMHVTPLERPRDNDGDRLTPYGT